MFFKNTELNKKMCLKKNFYNLIRMKKKGIEVIKSRSCMIPSLFSLYVLNWKKTSDFKFFVGGFSKNLGHIGVTVLAFLR